jgi:hypothetical protein
MSNGIDPWGSDDNAGPDVSTNDAKELEREWNARREEFWNPGYREGIEAGKHETVQEGFDEGTFWNAVSY